MKEQQQETLKVGQVFELIQFKKDSKSYTDAFTLDRSTIMYDDMAIPTSDSCREKITLNIFNRHIGCYYVGLETFTALGKLTITKVK